MVRFIFLISLFFGFELQAQFCWDPNQPNLDARINRGDRKVEDIAQLANEMAQISSRAGEVTVLDFFVAALIKESPSGKSATNNTIEAILDHYSITDGFKRMLVNEFNVGEKILEIKNGELVLVNKYEATNWNAENVRISSGMNKLFEEAHNARSFENTQKGSGEGSPFLNSYTGPEHFVMGALQMSQAGNPVGTFFTNNINASVAGRLLSFGRKAKTEAKIKSVIDAMINIRGEGGKNGVQTRTSFENYTLGNGKSFYTEGKEAVTEPTFLTDMVARAQANHYGPIHVRPSLIKRITDILASNRKNSVELNSEFDGVGKKSLVIGLAKMLADIKINGRNSEYYDLIPRSLHDIKLYEIDSTSLMGSGQHNTMYVGGTARVMEELKSFISSSNNQTVIVFKNMEGVYTLGETKGSPGLGEMLVDIIRIAQTDPNSGLRVMAVTNKVTGKQVKDTGWGNLVERINVVEPTKSEVKEIAYTHFERIKEDNPRIEIESLEEVFDYVYNVSSRYPNLGDKLQAVFRIYDGIAIQLKDLNQTSATEVHVLEAASRNLGNTPVEGGRHMSRDLMERISRLEENLNGSIKERGKIINEIVSKILGGLFGRTPIVSGTVRPKARSVTILVGPSGTLKTSIVELLAKELNMPFDKIPGAQANTQTLYDIAKKVSEENPSRIVYISEANRAHGIFDMLENMIDGFGITNPTTGKKTTFENVHFVLDANIPRADAAAKIFGLSETAPEALIARLNEIRNSKELENVMVSMKEKGEFSYRDSNGEMRTISISENPHGLVQFTNHGRSLLNDAIKQELGGREAFMGRAGDPIYVGYLSKNSYKEVVNFVLGQKNKDFKENYNGSEIVVTDRASDFLAEHAMKPANIELGARAVENYLNSIVQREMSTVWRSSRLYRNPEGLFVGKFRLVLDRSPNGRGITAKILDKEMIH